MSLRNLEFTGFTLRSARRSAISSCASAPYLGRSFIAGAPPWELAATLSSQGCWGQLMPPDRSRCHDPVTEPSQSVRRPTGRITVIRGGSSMNRTRFGFSALAARRLLVGAAVTGALIGASAAPAVASVGRGNLFLHGAVVGTVVPPASVPDGSGRDP